MTSRLVSFAKGVTASLLLVANTLCIFSAMIPFALLKLLVPLRVVRRFVDRILNGLAEMWIGFNAWWMGRVQQTRWDVSGIQNLKARGWYLVSSNHQSWVDILVLQKHFNRHIPMLKFFIKKELIYVPIIGLAWWALDFPFMRRQGGPASLAKDMAAARKSCERFRLIPTSVISFLEGTRFTAAKCAEQGSPYTHLLKPKLGGIAMALATMGDKFDALLDVTIVYPRGVPGFWDLLSGKVKEVVVRVREVQIPRDLKHGEDAADPAYRTHLQAWIKEMWAEKDRRIGEILAQQAPQPAARASQRVA